MAYDTWDVDQYLANREIGAPAPHPDDDIILWAVPKYRLHVFRDRGMRWTVARLQRKRAPSDGWQTLHEASVETTGYPHELESERAAVAQLLANRRYLRAVGRGAR